VGNVNLDIALFRVVCNCADHLENEFIGWQRYIDSFRYGNKVDPPVHLSSGPQVIAPWMLSSP
jgi:hypothetical protein